MAFLAANPFLQQDEQQKQALQSVAPSGVSAGGGATAANTVNGAAAAPRPGQQGTGFVNAQQFMDANQGAASKLGQDLANRVEGEYNDAQSSRQQVQNTYGAGVGQGGPTSDGKFLNNAYSSISATPGYGDASQKAATATWDAKALTNNQDRLGLLQSYYGQSGYTPGQQSWDNEFATQGGGNARLFLDTAQGVGDQSQSLANLNAGSGGLVAAPPSKTAPTAAPQRPVHNDPSRPVPGSPGAGPYTPGQQPRTTTSQPNPLGYAAPYTGYTAQPANGVGDTSDQTNPRLRKTRGQ